MKFYRNLNIKNKLLFIFSLQMVLPIVILGIFLLKNVENNMKSQAATLSQDMLKVLETRITDFTNDIVGVSQDLLYDLEVYDVLNDQQTDKLGYYNNVNNLTNVLRTLTLSNDEISALAIVDKQGNNYAYDLISGRRNIQNIFPYEHLLTIARQAMGRPVWFFDQANDEREVYLTRIINDIDTFEEVGLLVIKVDLEPMQKDFQSLSSSLFENVLLVEEGGNVVFSSDGSTRNFDNLKEEKAMVFYENESNERIISYRRIDHPEWTIVTTISKKVLMADIHQFTAYTFIIFIPLGIILSLFTIFEGMHMVEAIHKIVEGMKKVSKGEKRVNIQVDRYDEIGFLADSFNDMTSEIENLVHTIYKEQLTRKEVEIKALQAQINPHFLFNTLETINWHAQLKGAPEISNMVTALSSIMEANIGRDNKLITFREELKYIENYISIMTYRYEGRLHFEKMIDPSILNIRIPRLILQPIVENAIIHGIGQTTEIGKIVVTAKLSEGHILIEVSDNGKGMTKQQLNDLRKCFAYGNDESKSIGLENVNKRLKLFYGDAYGIEIMSEPHIYTKVIITIPEKRLNEGDSYYV